MSAAASVANPSPPPGLTSAQVLRLYIPLALSWLFMALEAPICQGLISRLPEAKLHSAAVLIVFSLSIWIESPVIDLLSTSTTLAKGKASYWLIRNFAIVLMVGVTIVHALVALTPIYDFVAFRVLGLEVSVAEAARPGMIAMIPWSFFIGWRRFLQGLMISQGRTKMIGIGTVTRVSTVAIVGFSLYFAVQFTGLEMSSVVIASLALVASVAVEAVFIHAVSRGIIRDHFSHSTEADELRPLDWRRLTKFHAPLTATSMVMLIGGPMISAALSRSEQSVLALAGWQVAVSLIFVQRTIVFALPEVVISLYRDEQSLVVLRKFCVAVGLLASGVMAFMALVGLDRLIFSQVLGAEPAVAHQAHLAYLAAIVLPFIGAIQSYMRGVLTKHHRTSARFAAVVIGMGTLTTGLVTIVLLGWSGVVAASIVLACAMLLELAWLAHAWRVTRMREPVLVP